LPQRGAVHPAINGWAIFAVDGLRPLIPAFAPVEEKVAAGRLRGNAANRTSTTTNPDISSFQPFPPPQSVQKLFKWSFVPAE